MTGDDRSVRKTQTALTFNRVIIMRYFHIIIVASLLMTNSLLASDTSDSFHKPVDKQFDNQSEAVMLPRLLGVSLSAKPLLKHNGAGVTISELPLLENSELIEAMQFFLNKPVTNTTIELIQTSTRIFLNGLGYPFAVIYTPEQDITSGHINFVVLLSRLSEKVEVTGAQYFSEDMYRNLISLQPGQLIDSVQLQQDVDWINRNGFRRAQVITTPGQEPGTTKVVLNVKETNPWRFFSGASNTGSKSTKYERVQTGISWGNAFGLGHQMTLQLSADPDMRHSKSLSGSYSIDLASHRTLRFNAAVSKSNSIVIAPFDLQGKSWQVSAAYEIPITTDNQTVSDTLRFSVDFKSSDNNFDFADIPISDNLTHVVQFVGSYDRAIQSQYGSSRLSAGLKYSPGYLTSKNKDELFNQSRAGSSSRYLAFNASASHIMPVPILGEGFSWSSRANLQLANKNLIGSEQLGAGGSATVRGYEEGEVFADNGVVISHELNFPTLSPLQVGDQLGVSVFQDLAHLRNKNPLSGERDITLHSVGVAANYRFNEHVGLNLSYGFQLKQSGSSDSGDHQQLHFSFNSSF